MFLRVRRARTTYFLTCEPADSVATAKARLAAMLGKAKDKDLLKEMKLHIASQAQRAANAAASTANTATNTNTTTATTAPTYVPLEEVSTLEQLCLVNDSVVFLTYWIYDSSHADGGYWEPINIPEFEPLNA